MIQEHMEDLYRILQVDSKADPDVIRAAFRVLSQKYHPDLNHTSKASEAMMRLNGTYETLRNTRLRSAYDGQRVTGTGQSTGMNHDPDFAD
jgi:molecular chaperone DnaJ